MSVPDGLSLVCSGFLLAVLWMDLIFDSQIRSVRGGELPEPILASIAGYYRRATTTSRPMSRLIAAVMVTLLGTFAFRAVRGEDPIALTVVSAVLAAIPILLAMLRTLPDAVRLGARSDGPVEQSRLARSIFRDHIVCLLAISALLAVLLVW
jgi:hypothetical protein